MLYLYCNDNTVKIDLHTTQIHVIDNHVYIIYKELLKLTNDWIVITRCKKIGDNNVKAN